METRRTLMISLAVVVVIASVFWTTTAAHVEKFDSCCTKVSTSELTDPIIGFRFQRESLPCVRAVIFETERGEFCSHPRPRWVKKKIEQFRKQTNTTAPPSSSSISDRARVRSTQATDSL